MDLSTRGARQPLTDPPCVDAKRIILRSLFVDGLDQQNQSHWEEFFRFYHTETKALYGGDHSSKVIKYAMKQVPTHGTICQLISDLIQASPLSKRGNLITIVQGALSSGDADCVGDREKVDDRDERPEDHIVDSILRISLMVNINKQPSNDTEVVQWNFDDKRTVAEFLDGVFPRPVENVAHIPGRLHPYFTAVYMSRLCQLELRWTDSLEDHLRIKSDGRRRMLKIFGHKWWLLEQIELYSSNKAPNLQLPVQLLHETVWTLDLLFPYSDASSRTFCDSMGWHFYKFGPLKCRLDLSEYSYWRKRLIELNEDVFRAPPASWRQLFLDRRNPQQYWTFWIAIIILLLTVVSTVLTAIQTTFTVLAFYR